MKTSLRRLRGAIHRHGGGDAKSRRDLRPLAQLDELAKASQDMQDMRDCYDSLLSAAAATANSAYEFSESLREMGACLLEKTALNDDEESGKVLLMLGKAQFELQKFVDSYRSHIFQTITSPSESLLNELRTVEEMKRQCDEKRDVYEYMVMRQREKGRSKDGKGESFSIQQLQEAHNEYDEEATLFVFRLKSLKQGQSRSLLTQAARHHAAQLCFFKKALKSLEAIEPHVKFVTEQQHIDYQFSGLEDEDGDDGNENDDDDDELSDVFDDGELSFDYGQNDHEQDGFSTARNSMELDQSDLTFPVIAKAEAPKEILDRRCRKSFSCKGEIRASSQSAPLFVESKDDPAGKLMQTRSSLTRRFNTYVLPTPVDTKSSNATVSSSMEPNATKTSLGLGGVTHNLWHSLPLTPKKYEQTLGDEKISRSGGINTLSVLRESNNNAASAQFPPPLADGLLYSQVDPLAASDSKKIKRQSFSGPLSNQWSNKPVSLEPPLLYSGPILRSPMPQMISSSLKLSSSPKLLSSPKVSPSASPTFLSSPKISELHELPRPPASSVYKSSRVLGLMGHSGPLLSRSKVISATSKSVVSNSASPLPKPPQAITRSFSIPSSSHKVTAITVTKPVDSCRNSEIAEDVASPPLTPISLSNQSSSTGPDPIQAVEMKGNEHVNP